MPTSSPVAPLRPPPGLFQSIREYLATWVEVLRTRLDLFSTEWQEEWQRLEQILILAAAAIVCLTFAALLATLLVVAAFWETNYRLAVLAGCAGLYLAAGIVVGLIARRKSRNKPKLFSTTIGELAKDYQHLS